MSFNSVNNFGQVNAPLPAVIYVTERTVNNCLLQLCSILMSAAM